MEAALEEEGIVPVTLSSADQVQGALPLDHLKCCVLNLHGDYLDTRIRNTASELEKYPPQMNKLISRICEDYGIIVCGWSAIYDTALRSALLRSSSRRFPLYWAQKGDCSDEALKVINGRGAWVIDVPDADTFFQRLLEYVDTLEVGSRPGRLTVATAVRRLKQYLPEPNDWIRLRDLADEATASAVSAMSSKIFQVGVPQSPLNEPIETLQSRLSGYVEASSILLEMGPVAGYYSNPGHFDTWRHVITNLATSTPGLREGNRLGWKAVPATLFLYSVGLGAIVGDRLDFLGHLFHTSIDRERGSDLLAVRHLHPRLWFDRMFPAPVERATGPNGGTVLISQWLNKVLRQPVAQVIPNPNLYTYYLDKLEILMALSYLNCGVSQRRSLTGDLGGFIARPENTVPILHEIEDSIEQSQDKDHSRFVGSGIAGERYEDWQSAIASLKIYLKTVAPFFFHK